MSTTRQKRKTSNVWQYFAETNTPKKVSCTICSRVCSVSGGSTGNLIRHMKMKHPKVLFDSSANETFYAISEISSKDNRNTEEPVHAILEICDSTDTPKTATVVEASNSNAMAYYLMEQIDDNKSKEIDKQLLRIIVKEFHPFSLTEDNDFISFVSMLNPNYTLPSHKSLSEELLPQTYESTVNDLKSTFKDITYAALTTDMWTTINNEDCIAVTVHYLNKDLKLKASLLDCISFPKNSPVNIAVYLQEVVANWGLSNKIVAAVTENVPNMVEAIKECQWQHISCFAHTLNTIVKAGLENINDVLIKVRNTVEYFKRNSTAMTKFYEIQNEMGLANLKLKKDTPVRWNSTFDMITRFLKNKDPLLSVNEMLQADFTKLSSDDWIILDNAVKLLVSFNTITVEICSEKTVPLSKVPYMVRFMIRHLTNILEHHDMPPEVVKMGCTLKKELTTRFKDLETNDVIHQCVLLDPRFKKRGFPDNSFEEAYSSLHKKVVSLKSEKNEVCIENSTQSGIRENSKQSEYFIDMWSEFRENDTSEQQNLIPAATVEIDAFLNETYLNMKDSPLTYWANKLNQKKFPTLFELVKSRLCVPATSIPCENIFSKEGNVLLEKRNLMTSEKLKEILFLQQNF